MNPKSKKFKNMERETVGDRLDLEQTHGVLLEMAKALHDFCEEHDITYYLFFGTMLGAVRHKGFIPWDDDVDVCMPREDYERFVKFSRISDRYQMVNFNDDKGYYHPHSYCSLTDTHTVIIEHDSRFSTGKGQFIDVFPLDNVPDGFKRRLRFLRLDTLNFIQGMQGIDYKNYKVRSPKDFVKRTCAWLFTPFDVIKIVAKMDKTAKKETGNDNCSQVGIICGSRFDRSQLYPRELFEGRRLVPFEKYEFYILDKYDEVLTIQYGDYMQLPPEEDRAGHHGVDLYFRRGCVDAE